MILTFLNFCDILLYKKVYKGILYNYFIMEDKSTTVKMKVSIVKRLRKYEIHPRESTNEIINKILDKFESKKT